MLGFLNAPSTKPNRVSPEGGKKDEKYHVDYGKYCTANAYSDVYARFLRKYQINKKFYSGKQWEDGEDLETFLKDTDGNVRNRIQIVFNVIRPLVEQYRGNSNILRIGASCQSSSPRSITRKEEDLAQALFRFELSQQSDVFANAMGSEGIGETEAETTAIFENSYVDKLSLDMDRLLRYIADNNRFDDMKIKVGEDLALSGMAIMEGFEYGQHLRFENCPPDEFFWDTSAKQYDLTDSEYMGRTYLAMPTEIYEQYQVAKEDQDVIERYLVNNAGGAATVQPTLDDTYRRSGYSDNRVPVYRVYWKDIDAIEYGYVMSEEDSYKILVRLDVENDDGSLKYTEDMLVDPPSKLSHSLKKVFKNGKKKGRLTVDTLRYCVFIPSDVLASGEKDQDKENNVGDVVLDYGVYEYQEVNNTDFRSVKFPFKCYCWGYVDGEVLSPVDDAISPQRFINRVLSVAENQINNSGGASFIYDSSAVDPQDGEKMLMKNISMSRPIKMNSRGIGMPNIIAPYDNNPKAGTYGLFDIIPQMKGIIDQSTGVNEALRGESIGQDQLVGVTDSLIQRGSLMQEPFYHGITRIFTQMYEMCATVGRNIYVDNEASLHVAVGDEAAEVIKLSKDTKLEDFRVFVKRDQDDETNKKTANSQLQLFKEMNLIDEKDFANLYDRSTPAEVTNALRANARAKIEVQRQQEKQDAEMQQQQAQQMQQQEQQMMAQQQQQEQQMKQDEAQIKEADHLNDIELAYVKEDAKMGSSSPIM